MQLIKHLAKEKQKKEKEKNLSFNIKKEKKKNQPTYIIYVGFN